MNELLDLLHNRSALLVVGSFLLICVVAIVIAGVQEERETSNKYACDHKEKGHH